MLDKQGKQKNNNNKKNKTVVDVQAVRSNVTILSIIDPVLS